MSRTRSILWNRMTFGSALLILAVTLCITRWGFKVPVEQAASSSVRGVKAGDGGQRLIFAAGVVEGTSEPLEVRFEVPGRIQEIHVHEGQQVQKDELLAELDPEGFELGVRAAEASLRTAQLQSEMAEGGSGHATTGAGSKGPGSNSSTTRSVSATFETRTNQQLIASSLVEAAEFALQKEQWQLEKCRLQSPIDGTIIECTVQPGELVGPQVLSGVFRIVCRDKTRVRAWVEELDAMDVRPGLSAMVVASGSVDRKYRGHIVSCASYVQPKSERHLNPGERVDVRVREIVIELKDGHELLLGLPVEVFIAPSREARKESKSDRKISSHESE